MERIYVTSSIDGSKQSCLFFRASKPKRPLIIALHTWSFGEENQIKNMLPYAEREDWNLLLPNYRGGNKKENPEHKDACCSKKAIMDIIDATKYAIANLDIDVNALYLFGASAGGQAALIATAKAPTLWHKVAAYVPVCDLKGWYDDCVAKGLYFVEDIIACVGEYNEEEYLKRSPIYYVEEIAKANSVKIFCGKYDHIVNIKHGIRFYNRLMSYDDKCHVFFEVFNGRHHVNYQAVIDYFKGNDVTLLVDLTI